MRITNKQNINYKKCMICEKDIEVFQVRSGLPTHRDTEGIIRQTYGHYHCIKDYLGPERLLKAINFGLIPLLPDDLFTADMKLKKLVSGKLENSAKSIERIYEFIES